MPDVHVLHIEAETDVHLFGDIHGSAKELQAVIDLPRVADRKKIIIGLGDYIDRANDSAAALDALMKSQVIAIRGNHEDQFLKYVDCLDSENTKYSPEEKEYFLNWYLSQKEKAWVKLLKEEQRKCYYDYLAQLPYMVIAIRPDQTRFIAVHAGNPFTDTEINDIVNQVEKNSTYALSDEAKKYMIWAKSHPKNSNIPALQQKYRQDSADLTYVAHNALEGLRIATAEINLDIQTCTTGQVLVVNDSTRECFICDAYGKVKRPNNTIKESRQIKKIWADTEFFLHLPTQTPETIDQFILDHYVDQRVDFSQRKQQYLKGLSDLHKRLEEKQRQQWASYLLNQAPHHLLKIERHPFIRFFQGFYGYSYQTFSMHQAINQLMGNPLGHIQRFSWTQFFRQLFFKPTKEKSQTKEIEVEGVTYTFSRHTSKPS